IGNQNRLIGVPGNANQNMNGNGNLVAARVEGNAAGQDGNQIRCYNCRGVEEFDLMAAAADLDEIKEVNANCILMANLQQASTSGTQSDKAPVYDSDGSAEVHENCDDNEIFNMFTQEEQYTELLKPIFESHQVPQIDNNVISKGTSVKQSGETIEEHPANFEETPNYTQLYDFLKYNQKEVDELKTERLAKTQDPLALMANSNNPYAFLTPHQDQSLFNQNYMQQLMPNLEDITDLTTAMNVALALMAKAFKLNYSSPTNNNQRISSNPRN
nr:hypothetical protein [Tanacetum cinerariifolium]